MSIKCLFGFHLWDGCRCSRCGQKRDESHSWDGCKCSKCGQKRNEAHSWDGCKCSRCGQQRNEDHRLKECKCEICGMVLHKWYGGFTCRECGIAREKNGQCKSNTSGKTVHEWGGGCTCIVCGVVRENKGHHWEDGICIICGKEKVFTANFEEVAEKASLSQQAILIKYKAANKLLEIVTETVRKAQNLEFDKAYDRAKQMIRLECPNCGKLTKEAMSSIYFFAEGGAVESLGGLIGVSNIASVSKGSCPHCHATELRAVIKQLPRRKNESKPNQITYSSDPIRTIIVVEFPAMDHFSVISKIISLIDSVGATTTYIGSPEMDMGIARLLLARYDSEHGTNYIGKKIEYGNGSVEQGGFGYIKVF